MRNRFVESIGCIAMAILVSWTGAVLAQDGPALDKAVRTFLKTKCGNGQIEFEKGKAGMIPAYWRCDRVAKADDWAGISVSAIGGSFTGKDRKEAFLAVHSPGEVPHSEGFGYTVFMRNDGADWKVVSRGEALPVAERLGSIPTGDGTSVIFLCSSDCWQSCCIGGCSVNRLKSEGKTLELTNAGAGFPVGDSGDLPGQEYRATTVKSVDLRDVDKDGRKDLVVVVHVEEGKADDEVGERKPSSSKDIELKFLFDGKSFKPAPGAPKLEDFSC
jgi:hypothetical protein